MPGVHKKMQRTQKAAPLILALCVKKMKYKMEYEISDISNGQYSVSINLESILNHSDITQMKNDLKDITQNDPFINDKNGVPIISINGNKISYLSETIFPQNTDQSKQKVLLNPATHSIKYGMFLFSKKNLNRHNMWKKLDDATLIPNVNYSNLQELSKIEKREKEAFEKKSMILNGETSSKYLLGLTTFYSFPTPVVTNYRFSNVQGVLKFFGKIINSINYLEHKRLLEYSFSKSAVLVFIQNDSYIIFRTIVSQSKHQFFKNLIYWPAVSRARGAKNSGNDLLKMLESING
jgi:hypothetical protein